MIPGQNAELYLRPHHSRKEITRWWSLSGRSTWPMSHARMKGIDHYGKAASTHDACRVRRVC